VAAPRGGANDGGRADAAGPPRPRRGTLPDVFDHVTIRATDREASERFYETVLRALGREPTYRGEDLVEWDDFSVAQADADHPPTRGLHLGFAAPSREHVDAFHAAGTGAGYRDDGAPGPRPQYMEDYYGSFLLDPDGNSAEAVHHGDLREDGTIDHLWIRVPDVRAAKLFYESIAPHAGLRLGTDLPERALFRGQTGSFSLVAAGPPTENVHLAFPAADDGTVNAFHRAALAGGYEELGPPGERPEYHPGYYAAYVRDPAGHNVEVVHHDRR
jgi:catechol 2,3-dioxygenase-like lactoylglutathione lyase family enzyme